MAYNYDSTNVGVPFVRAQCIVINYPVTQQVRVEIHQSEAIKLADNTVRELDQLPKIITGLNLADATPIPLVDVVTGAPLGPSVTMGQVMLSILAVVRKLQNEQAAQLQAEQPVILNAQEPGAVV